MRLSRLAEVLGAELVVPSSDPEASDAQITGVASAARASMADIVFAESEAAFSAALASLAATVIISQRLRDAAGASPAKPLLLVLQPKLAFARAAQLLRHSRGGGSVHPSAQIVHDAVIGENVTVGAFASLGTGVHIGSESEIGAGAVIGAGVSVGANCRIYPRVVIYPGVTLGDRVVVHAGAVLGADGFGYVRDELTGAYVQFPQQGTLVIEDDVEIGANSTVDRGALDETRICRGAKIDNLVHIGHNVRVGADVVIAAQTGISGSSVIGDGAVIGGQVGIADHVTIGDGVILGAQAGVPSRKKLGGSGVVFWGTPARPIQQYLKQLAALARLAKGSGIRDQGSEIGDRGPEEG